MRRLLCFGDSNTYGFAPPDGRYPAGVCWTDCLSALARDAWQVIPDGLCGRTVGAFDAVWREKNGVDAIRAALSRHAPLHALVISLGSNDALHALPHAIAADMRALLGNARCVDRVLLVAPPPSAAPRRARQTALDLARAYCELAIECGADFADAGAWDIALCPDGAHYAPAGHAAFARHVWTWLSAT